MLTNINTKVNTIKDSTLKLKKDISSKRFYDIQNIEFMTDPETGKINLISKNIIAVAENDAFREDLINIPEKKVTLIDTKHSKKAKKAIVYNKYYNNIAIIKKGGHLATDELISVTVSNATASRLTMKSLYVTENNFYVEYHDKRGTQYTDLLSKEPVTFEYIKANNAKRYSFLLASPSGIRTTQFLMLKYDDIEDSQEFVSKAYKMLDSLTQGMFFKYVNEQVDWGKLVKLAGRISLPWTGNKYVGEVKNYAIFSGQWKIDGVEFFDGSSLITDTFWIDVLEKNGMKLNGNLRRAAELRPQFRCLGCSKNYGQVVSNNFINEIVEIFERNENVVRIDTPDKLASLANKLENEYAGKLVIVGNSTPDIIMDMNNVKAMVDFTRGCHLNILDIAKFSPANTNAQIAQSLSVVPHFDCFFANLGKEYVTKELENVLKQSELPTKEKGFVNDVIASISIDYARTDISIWSALMKAKTEGMQNRVSRSKYPVAGAFCRGTGDFGSLLGFRVLKDNECYAPGVAIGKVEVTRNPHMGICEHMVLNNISLKTIITRIKNSTLLFSQKYALIDTYSLIGKSTMVAPSTNEFKDATGGSDFDYDGFTVISDPRWVSFAEQLPTEAISYNAPKTETNKTDNELFSFTLGNIAKGVHGQMFAKNESIGILCHRVSKLMSLHGAGDKDVLFVQKMAFKKEFVSDDKETEYVRLFEGNSNIHDKEIQQCWERYLKCNGSPKSFRLFIYDAVACYCSIVGRTIDAAKTGETVLSFCCDLDNSKARTEKRAISSLLLSPIGFVVQEGKYSWGYESLKGDHRFDCVMNKARIKVIEFAASRLSDIAKAKEVDESTYDAIASLRGADVASLRLMKEVYDDVCNAAATSSSDKQAMFDAIANTIRASFAKDADYIDRFYALKHVAMVARGSGADIGSGRSSFAKALPEEMILAVAELYGKNRLVGSEFVPMNYENVGEGMTLDFTRGYSDYGVTVDKNIDGDYTIKRINNTLYAVRDITESVKVPAMNKQIALKVNNNIDDSIIDALTDADKKVVLESRKSSNRIYVLDKEGKTVVSYGLRCNPESKIGKGLNKMILSVENVNVFNTYNNGKERKCCIIIGSTTEKYEGNLIQRDFKKPNVSPTVIANVSTATKERLRKNLCK